MSTVLSVTDMGLAAGGRTLSARLSAGQSLAVLGRAASGKSRLLRVLGGAERPAQGIVELDGAVAVAGLNAAPRRATPQLIATRAAGVGGKEAAAGALGDLGLWDVRAKALSELSPGQIAACELLVPLLAQARLLVVDGQLDRLDPWTLPGAWERLQRRLAQGAAVVAATHRTDQLASFSSLVVLKAQDVRFFGSLADLLRSAKLTEIIVETDDEAGVRALVEPFEVTLRQTKHGLAMRAAEGREIAAKLLLEGYGDVKLTLVREPTPDEALRKLF